MGSFSVDEIGHAGRRDFGGVLWGGRDQIWVEAEDADRIEPLGDRWRPFRSRIRLLFLFLALRWL